MSRDVKNLQNLYKLIFENHNIPPGDPLGDDNSEEPTGSDMDADFNKGETNFPHGNGYPNVDKDYEKVVSIEVIYGTDERAYEAWSAHEALNVTKKAKQLFPWITIPTDSTNLHYIWDSISRSVTGILYWIEDKTQYLEGWRKEEKDNALKIAQQYPDLQERWNEYNDFISLTYQSSPDSVENPKNYPVFVTLYDRTRRMGGHEEGGWYYDYYEVIDSHSANNYPHAEKIAKYLYNKSHRGDLDGQPWIILEKKTGSQVDDSPRTYQ